MTKNILVTGGAGYIGSHTVLELLATGNCVTIYDNFSNSSQSVVPILEDISNKSIDLEVGDLRDVDHLNHFIKSNNFSAIIHFAGLKAVGESVEFPLKYYRHNVEGSMNLIEAAIDNGINKFLFSSSATVYGPPEYLPIDENHPVRTTNPYGETKRVVEKILESVSLARPDFQYGNLRYFNPIGAHESGRIGEDPQGIPNNLMPYVAQVAVGKRRQLSVFGGDYDTPDGTGVRDYIHVVDLAKAHVKGLEKLFSSSDSFTVNLGTGEGVSVLEAVRAFEKASAKTVLYEIVERRAGDVASCYADPCFAEKYLNWVAEHNLERMCKDHWRWQKKNPDGYVLF